MTPEGSGKLSQHPSIEVPCGFVLALYEGRSVDPLPRSLSTRLVSSRESLFPDVFCSWLAADPAALSVEGIICKRLKIPPFHQIDRDRVRAEVLMAAMEAVVTGALNDHLTALVAKIAVHKCLRCDQTLRSHLLTHAAGATDSGCSTASSLRDWFDAVHAAMEAISPEKRDVIRLSYLEERDDAEVALQLKIPRGTVKSRKKYALEELLDIMMRRHIESLPEDLTELVRLHLYGVTEMEIAGLLGIAPGDVSARLAQARALAARAAGLI